MSKMPTVKVNGMDFYTDDEYFGAWMWKVDQIIVNAIGFGVYDIGDRMWRDSYDDCSTPLQAVEDLIGDPDDDEFGNWAVFG